MLRPYHIDLDRSSGRDSGSRFPRKRATVPAASSRPRGQCGAREDFHSPLRLLAKGHSGGKEKEQWDQQIEARGECHSLLLPLPSTLAIAVIVFQLRVVAGTPNRRSIDPR